MKDFAPVAPFANTANERHQIKSLHFHQVSNALSGSIVHFIKAPSKANLFPTGLTRIAALAKLVLT
jgi:hypothetical protein